MIFILFLYLADVFAVQNFEKRKTETAQSHQYFPRRETSNDMILEFGTTIDVRLAAKLQRYGRSQSRSTRPTLVSTPKGKHITDKLPYYYNFHRKLHDDTKGKRRLEHLQVTTGLLPDVTVTVQPRRSRHTGLPRTISVQPMTTRHKKEKMENDVFPVFQSSVVHCRREQFPERPTSKNQRIYVNIDLLRKRERWWQCIDSLPMTKVISTDEFKYAGITRDIQVETDKKGKNKDIAFPVSPAIPGWQLKFTGPSPKTDKRSSAEPESFIVQGTDQTGSNKVMAYSDYLAKLPAILDSWQQFPDQPVDIQKRYYTTRKYRGFSRNIPVTVQTKKSDQKGQKKNIALSVSPAIPGWRLQFPGHFRSITEINSEPEYQGLSRDALLKTNGRKGENVDISFSVSPAIHDWQLKFPGPSTRMDEISSADPESFTVQGTDRTGENKVTAYSVYQAKRLATNDSWQQFPDRPVYIQERYFTTHKYRGFLRDKAVTLQPKKTDQKGHKKNIAYSVSPAIPGWRLQFPGHFPRITEINSAPEYQVLSRDALLKTTGKKGENIDIAFPVSSAIPGWQMKFPGPPPRTDKRSSAEAESFIVQGTDQTGENKVTAYSVYQAKRPVANDSWQQFPDRPEYLQKSYFTTHKYRGFSRDTPVTLQPKRTDQNRLKKNIAFPASPAIPGWRLQFPGPPPRTDKRSSADSESFTVQGDQTGENKVTAYSVYQAKRPTTPDLRHQFSDRPVDIKKRSSTDYQYRSHSRDIPVTVQPKTDQKEHKKNVAFSVYPGWRLQFPGHSSRMTEISSELKYQGLLRNIPVSVQQKRSYHKGKNNISFLVSPAISGWQLQYHDPVLRLKETSSVGPEYHDVSRNMPIKTTDNKPSQKNIAFKVRPQAIPAHQFLDPPLWMHERFMHEPGNPSLQDTPVIVHGTNQKGDKKEITFTVSQTIPGWRLQFLGHHPRMNETSMKPKNSGLSRDIPVISQPNTTDQKGVKTDITRAIHIGPQQLPEKPNMVKEIFSTYEPRYTGLSDIPVAAQGMIQNETEKDIAFPVSPAIPGWQLRFPGPPLSTNEKHSDGFDYAGLLRDLPVYAQSNTTHKKDTAKIIAYSVAPALLDSRLKSSLQPPRKEDAKIIAYSIAPAFPGSRLQPPDQPPKINEGMFGEPKHSDLSRDTPVAIQGTDQKRDTKNIFQAKPPATASWRPQYPELPAITDLRSSDEFLELKKYLEKYPEGTMEPEKTQSTQYDMNLSESVARKRQKINLDVEVKVEMSLP